MDDDTEVVYSCSITWHNELYVFGGSSMKTQISRVNNCHLERVGNLEFDHSRGDCVNVADERIYLCFGRYEESDLCRVGSTPLGHFTVITPSNHKHARTRIATNNGNLNAFNNAFEKTVFISDVILAVGGEYSRRAELLSVNGNKWADIDPYPLVNVMGIDIFNYLIISDL